MVGKVTANALYLDVMKAVCVKYGSCRVVSCDIAFCINGRIFLLGGRDFYLSPDGNKQGGEDDKYRPIEIK